MFPSPKDAFLTWAFAFPSFFVSYSGSDILFLGNFTLLVCGNLVFADPFYQFAALIEYCLYRVQSAKVLFLLHPSNISTEYRVLDRGPLERGSSCHNQVSFASAWTRATYVFEYGREFCREIRREKESNRVNLCSLIVTAKCSFLLLSLLQSTSETPFFFALPTLYSVLYLRHSYSVLGSFTHLHHTLHFALGFAPYCPDIRLSIGIVSVVCIQRSIIY